MWSTGVAERLDAAAADVDGRRGEPSRCRPSPRSRQDERRAEARLRRDQRAQDACAEREVGRDAYGKSSTR